MANIIARKSYRILAVAFPVMYYIFDKKTTLIAIWTALSISVIIDILRRVNIRFNEIIFIKLGPILKQKERRGLLSTDIFLLAIALTVILFSKDIAILALLFLIFGDSASALVGMYFGRIKIGKKTLEGSLANFACCIACGLILNLTSINIPPAIIAIGALTAAVVELMPLPVDDNFTIALASGWVMNAMGGFIR